MATTEAPSFDEPDVPLFRPWPLLLAGLAAVGGSWLWSLALPDTAPLLRVLLVAGGLVGIGSALALYLPHASTGEMRYHAAGLLGLACLSCALASQALPAKWDSIRTLLQVFAVVAVGGAALFALPWRLAALAVGTLAVVHFGGIMTAIVAVPPPPSPNPMPVVQAEAQPTGQAPWLVNQVMMRFYLPYLQLLHLNNGYHFYAPEPGPVTLVWFRVEYADGSSRWVRLPDHDKAPNGLAKRRWGALATQTGQTIMPPPPDSPLWERFFSERRDAARTQGIPFGNLPEHQQYREPGTQARLLIASLARYVARHTPHPTSPEVLVTGVKVYRIDYTNAPPEAFREGVDPRDPTLYLAYYQGEFGPDGQIKPSSYRVSFNDRGGMIDPHKDPLLYWLIPIVREPVPPPAGAPGDVPPPSEEEPQMRLMNYLRIHAGDKGEESNP